jgi:hypothetical protein
MSLKPILERAAIAPGLDWDLHVCPSLDQLQSTLFQFQVHVVRTLTTYVDVFSEYTDHPALQHTARYLLPLVKMKTYPLRVTTDNEATVLGTIKIWEDIYKCQLKRSPDEMQDVAVPSFNDQLTNARVRGAKLMRKRDVDTFHRLDNIQLAYGVFHKCMNLIWAILRTHQGAISHIGSLKYYFALLEKTRLANEKPDYHTLLSALMQILNGLILQAWRQEMGASSFQHFAATKPTPQQLLDIAHRIITGYATPVEDPPLDNLPDDEDEDEPEDETESTPTPPPTTDNAHRNVRLLIRNLLYVAELIRAVSDGDWGRIEDILGQLAMMFRGAGSNNYSTELLHFIHNLKLVWTEDFANVMRRGMLVNLSGHPGKWMGTDMNIEHHIRYLKVCTICTISFPQNAH